MGKPSRKLVKHNIQELIVNLTQCDDSDNCKRCKHRNECLKHTRNVLAWVLDVFGNTIDIDTTRSDGVYL